MNAVSLTILHI